MASATSALTTVAEPKIQEPTDAIVRLTSSAICGTDLHFIRGTMSGMVPGTILGHEGVGVVEEVGKDVRNLNVGDRVVIPSTIACGTCSYCRAGYYAQCDKANPNGPAAGTAFFGGPKESGPFHGLQAEYARVPYGQRRPGQAAGRGLRRRGHPALGHLPDGLLRRGHGGHQAGPHRLRLGLRPGRPVRHRQRHADGRGPRLRRGRRAVASGDGEGAGRGDHQLRRGTPRRGASAPDGGVGPDCAIDAVGVDAYHAHSGPAVEEAKAQEKDFQEQQQKIAPDQNPHDGNWVPGDAPSQVNQWSVKSLAKAGTLAIIGVYPPSDQFFPIGAAMNKNLKINMGNCHHRKYIPHLVNLVRNGTVDPLEVLTELEPLTGAIDAYKAFDQRRPGWIKVELNPSA